MTPARGAVRLAGGARLSVPIEIRAAALKPGVYQVPVKLLRSDGTAEVERRMFVENLGRGPG